MAFKESHGSLGELKTSWSKNSTLVPCFPLHALLVALNQSTVDYFSLDVEGFELEVRPISGIIGSGTGGAGGAVAPSQQNYWGINKYIL